MNVVNFAGITGMDSLITVSPTVLVLIIIWIIFWKGLALWHASKSNQAWWFLALLVINTLGILEIIYLFGVLKLKKHNLFPKF